MRNKFCVYVQYPGTKQIPWTLGSAEQSLVPCPRFLCPAIPALCQSLQLALTAPCCSLCPSLTLESAIPLPNAGTGSVLKLFFNLNSQQHSHVGTLQQAAGAHGRVCLAHWEPPGQDLGGHCGQGDPELLPAQCFGGKLKLYF